jgi:hypothetical protein
MYLSFHGVVLRINYILLLFLSHRKSRSFSQVSSIKTFDFSTLYTTLPHDKLKTRLKETIHKAFSHRNYEGDKYVIDEELQHTDHLFLGVACFTFMNFV